MEDHAARQTSPSPKTLTLDFSLTPLNPFSESHICGVGAAIIIWRKMTVPEPIYYEPPTSDVNLNVNQAKPQLLKSQYKQPLNNELNLLISTLDQELSTGKVGATNTNIAYNTITPNAIASFAATSSRMTSTIHSNHGFPLPQQQQQRLPQLLPALNSICSHATNFYPPTFLPIRPPADLSSTEDSWTRRDQSAATPAPMLIDKHHLFHRQPRSLPQTPVEMVRYI